jgi:hypothetical protein
LSKQSNIFLRNGQDEWHRIIQFDMIELNVVDCTGKSPQAKNLLEIVGYHSFLELIEFSLAAIRKKYPQSMSKLVDVFVQALIKGYEQKTHDVIWDGMATIQKAREDAKEKVHTLLKFAVKNWRNYKAKRGDMANFYALCYYNYKHGLEVKDVNEYSIKKPEYAEKDPEFMKTAEPKPVEQKEFVFDTKAQVEKIASNGNGKKNPYFLPESMKFIDPAVVADILHKSGCKWQDFDGRIVYSATAEQHEQVKTLLNNLFTAILEGHTKVEGVTC